MLALFSGGRGATTLLKRVREAVKVDLDSSQTAISTLLVPFTPIAEIARCGHAATPCLKLSAEDPR